MKLNSSHDCLSLIMQPLNGKGFCFFALPILSSIKGNTLDINSHCFQQMTKIIHKKFEILLHWPSFHRRESKN